MQILYIAINKTSLHPLLSALVSYCTADQARLAVSDSRFPQEWNEKL